MKKIKKLTSVGFSYDDDNTLNELHIEQNELYAEHNRFGDINITLNKREAKALLKFLKEVFGEELQRMR